MTQRKGIIFFTVIFYILTFLIWGSENKKKKNLETTSLEITYIANEGYMIQCGTKKVLMDALFSDGGRYASPPKDVLGKMETAQSPFDGITLITTSHNHGDHFDHQCVARCLKNNPRAVFVSTPQAVDNLKKSDVYPKIKEQVIVPKLQWQSSTEKTINGIQLKIIRTHHSQSRPNPGKHSEKQNNMYLMVFGGKKIFHEGDSPGTVEAFKNLGLEKEGIDIAFVRSYFIFYERGKKILKKYIQPKHTILMHTREAQIDLVVNEAVRQMKDFPNLIVFRKPMEKKIY